MENQANSVTVLTVADGAHVPVIVEVGSSAYLQQWHKGVQAVSDVFFSSPESASCELERMEISGELKAEGGVTFFGAANLSVSVAGAVRFTFRRKERP